jgi:hypothetical protein
MPEKYRSSTMRAWRASMIPSLSSARSRASTEEVREVYPDLVVRNEAGEVETVQYHKLVPILLNELQRLRREVEEHRAEVAALQSRLDALAGRR